MRPYAELRRQFVDVTITHCVRRRWSSCGWEGNRGPVPLCVGGAAAAGGARSRSVRGPHGVRALAGVRPERRRDDTDPSARHCALLARPRPPQRPRAHRRPAGEVHTDTPRYYACSNRPHCRSAREVRVFTCSRTRTAMYFFGVAWILRPIKGVNFPPPKKKNWWGVNRPFQAKRAKHITFILSKLLHRLEPNYSHNDRDHQVLFQGSPNMLPTNPTWRTAAILE